MKYVFFFILILSINSCDNSALNKLEEKKNSINVEEKNVNNKINTSDKKLNFKTDKIIFARDVNTGNNFWGISDFKYISQITDSSKINYFENLLDKSYKKGYCCCPNRGYSILFFDKTNNYKTYFIDTVGSQDYLIFTTDYQFSHSITKSDWNNLLKSSQIISNREYFLCDLTYAREFFQFTRKNNLPVINSLRSSDMWVTKDGYFKFTTTRVAKNLTENEIVDNIKDKYPGDNYKIEISGSNRLGSTSDCSDCYTEYTVTIFCNKEFYDKFDLYKPKSYYQPFCAEFLVFGSKEQLASFDFFSENSK